VSLRRIFWLNEQGTCTRTGCLVKLTKTATSERNERDFVLKIDKFSTKSCSCHPVPYFWEFLRYMPFGVVDWLKGYGSTYDRR
jgi:hypothetical protein